jgi:hypothetical protein
LSFEKGDRLEIVDRPPTDPEWFKARNQKGQIGLVPRNYLQELQEYLNTPYRGGPDSLDRRPDMPSSGTSTMQSVSHGNGNGNGTGQLERPVLSGKSWYYGAITRNQCDTVLNSHGHDGDFLIRDSETNVSVAMTASIDLNSDLFNHSNLFLVGRFLSIAEGTRTQQAFSSSRRGRHVLHRPAKVPQPRSTRRSLPKSADLYKQAG